MPMRADEVAELSRLLDEALALQPPQRERWLGELEQTKPEVAQRLRDMLRRAESSDTKVLPRLPQIDADGGVAVSGTRVGSYVLVRELGRGGMGSVWLAERADGAFKRRVALKLPRLTWDAGLAKRMAREREIGALLEHPGIARLYDAGVDEHGRPYIAMEYIEGQPIDVYGREHALNLRTKLALFLQVVRAVAYAHGRLVLHRDLKPGNVLVDAAGQAHLLDFGIAKLLDEAGGADLTREQGRLLTLSYAAPEQIAGRALGVTADVYSLGVLLFELLTGSLPYALNRSTQSALEDAILAGDAPLASSRAADKRVARDLHGDLDAIVAKAIKRDPGERYQTVDALAADLQRYIEGKAIAARPDSLWYRLRKAVVRHRVPVAAATAVLVVALAGGAATLLEKRKVAAEAERTRLATAFVLELFRMNALQEPARGYDTTQSGNKPPVDRGIELIEVQFKGQPELQAELYGAVARVYVDLGIDRKAANYASRQLVSLRAQNADKAKIASAHMLLAEAALAANRNADAEEYARQALVMLAVSDTQTPDAFALLARALLRQGKREETANTVKKGQRILTAQKRPRSAAGAMLKFLEASLISLDKLDAAKRMIDAAIAEAIETEGPGSRTASRLQLFLAFRLLDGDRPEEARAYARRAIAALEQAGGVNRVRASLARANVQLRQFQEGAASFAETMAVLEEVSQFLRSPISGAPPESIAELDSMLARAYLHRGEHELACPLAEASGALTLQATQSLFREYLVAFDLGQCAMNLGHHELADKYLRQALTLRSKIFRADHPWASHSWAIVAFNLSMADRHQEAEAFLSGAPKFTNEQGTAVANYFEYAIPEALSRVRLNRGDVEGARAVFPDSERVPAYARIDEIVSFYELRGEIRCASGQYVPGLFDLRRSIDSQMATTGPNHPRLARARAIAGLCALAQGNRKMAEELAKESRQAFVAQPHVSLYFKEPLKRLERQLVRKPS